MATKKKKTIKKIEWRAFHVIVEYKSLPNKELDKQILVLARGVSEGSYYYFGSGTRDLSFGYPKRGQAVAAARRIKLALGRKVKAEANGRIWP